MVCRSSRSTLPHAHCPALVRLVIYFAASLNFRRSAGETTKVTVGPNDQSALGPIMHTVLSGERSTTLCPLRTTFQCLGAACSPGDSPKLENLGIPCPRYPAIRNNCFGQVSAVDFRTKHHTGWFAGITPKFIRKT